MSSTLEQQVAKPTETEEFLYVRYQVAKALYTEPWGSESYPERHHLASAEVLINNGVIHVEKILLERPTHRGGEKSYE